MKKMIFVTTLSFFASMQAWANWDGCYQLVSSNVRYQAICFQGTAEEGINGSNVRLFVFRTNTNSLDICALGSVTKLTGTELTFEKNGVKEVVLSNFDGIVADAEIDGFPTTVKAVRLGDTNAQTLWQNADSNVCQ